MLGGRMVRRFLAAGTFTLLVAALVVSPAFGESISADWNYSNKTGFGAYCSKGSIQAPGYSQASGRGWASATDTVSDCDADKYTAYSQVTTKLGYVSGSTWINCDTAALGWAYTSSRVATAVNGPCSGGHTFYTLTVPGSCIYGDCRNSGPTCTDPSSDPCTALNLYPLLSPGQYWS